MIFAKNTCEQIGIPSGTFCAYFRTFTRKCSIFLHENILNIWIFMRLRSGRILAEMVSPTKKFPSPKWSSKHRTTSHIDSWYCRDIKSRSSDFPNPKHNNDFECPHYPKVTQTVVGDPSPHYVLSSIPSLMTIDYPWGMPTSMMANLQRHALTFPNNAANIVSP